jgi:hypothetical protein
MKQTFFLFILLIFILNSNTQAGVFLFVAKSNLCKKKEDKKSNSNCQLGYGLAGASLVSVPFLFSNAFFYKAADLGNILTGVGLILLSEEDTDSDIRNVIDTQLPFLYDEDLDFLTQEINAEVEKQNKVLSSKGFFELDLKKSTLEHIITNQNYTESELKLIKDFTTKDMTRNRREP